MIDLEAALAQAREAAEASPDSWEPHARIGALLTTLGRPSEGADALRVALRLNPKDATIANNLGAAERVLGHRAAALACFERALQLNPDYVDARRNAALVHSEAGVDADAAGDADGAIRHFNQAIALDSSISSTWAHLALAYAQLGDFDRAEAAARRAITLDPSRPEHYRTLADLAPDILSVSDIATLEAMKPVAVTAQIERHVALGRAYQKSDVERSFQHVRAANSARRTLETYDETATLAAFENIAKVYSPHYLSAMSTRHQTTDVPVFIFGMPRSGTTLVEQILASHPRVFAAGEVKFFEELIASNGFTTLPQIEALGRRYLDALRHLSHDATRITDKMPFNFRYAGLIHLALPNARMIHVRRDPVAVGLSCYEQTFLLDTMPWANDLAELGRYIRGYLNLMQHWRTVLPQHAMLEIDYEELVRDFEPTARRLLDYVDLPWDDGCARFYEAKRPVFTASLSQVRQPIYETSLHRADAYREFLGPMIAELEK